MTTILILGATGQVGQPLCELALANPAMDRVAAPTRRPLPIHQKLENPIIDFGHLPQDASRGKADIAICPLGTTLRQARSRAGFYQVDHDFVIKATHLIHQAGTPVFGLVSSLGAYPSSRVFHLRVKGETARKITALAFTSTVCILLSSSIGGPRAQGHPRKAAGLNAGKVLSGLLPRRYRAVTTKAMARPFFDACLAAPPGLHRIQSEAIHG